MNPEEYSKNMNQETMQKDLDGRVQELLTLAKEKEIYIGACQQIDKKGRIETIPIFTDLKKYPTQEELKEVAATPSPEEFLPNK